jgi:hypothetical protein
LIVLSPDDAAPTLEAARAALDPERFDLAFLPDEPDPDALFGFSVEISGTVYKVTGEPAPQLHAWHFGHPRWAPGEQAAAEKAKFAIALEGTLDDPPLKAFRSELAVAAAFFSGRSPAVFDEAAARLIPGSHVRRLAASAALPAATELFTIHSIEPPAGTEAKRFWLHTHGLARAGVPDLDLLGVTGEDRATGGELLDATASLLLSHGVPPTGAPFPVGEGVEVVLLPLDEALARAPAREPGGKEREDDHREKTRLVLAPADARHGGSPSIAPLLPRARDAVLFRSEEDTERMRLVARETWGRFEALFRAHQGEKGWGFFVKLGFETDRARDRQEDVAREHLWFTVKALDGARIQAQLDSTPHDVSSVRKGDTAWHGPERLTDWLVFSPAGKVRPGTEELR